MDFAAVGGGVPAVPGDEVGPELGQALEDGLVDAVRVLGQQAGAGLGEAERAGVGGAQDARALQQGGGAREAAAELGRVGGRGVGGGQIGGEAVGGRVEAGGALPGGAHQGQHQVGLVEEGLVVVHAVRLPWPGGARGWCRGSRGTGGATPRCRSRGWRP